MERTEAWDSYFYPETINEAGYGTLKNKLGERDPLFWCPTRHCGGEASRHVEMEHENLVVGHTRIDPVARWAGSFVRWLSPTRSNMPG